MTRPPFILLMIAAAPLLAALVSQYMFYYPPCTLCLYQRVPYALICTLAVVGVFAPRYTKMILIFSILLLLANSGLALFHAGVEAGWWKFESACTANGNAHNLADLKTAIETAPLVMCDQAMLYVLGLSMAAWNAVYALAAATLVAYIAHHAKAIVPR